MSSQPPEPGPVPPSSGSREPLLADPRLAAGEDDGGRGESVVEPTGTEAPPREGLPRGFRMRHDAHYVEDLSARRPQTPLRHLPLEKIRAAPVETPPEGFASLVRSVRELGIVQPLVVRPEGRGYEVVAGATRLRAATEAGLETVPCIVQDVGRERARQLADAARVRAKVALPGEASEGPEPVAPRQSSALLPTALGEVERSLRSIVSSVEMMRSAPGELLERAGRDLMAAEAYRCEWLLRALRTLERRPAPQSTAFPFLTMLERLHQHLEPENRLLGVDVALDLSRVASRTEGIVIADESLIAVGLEGLYRGLRATLEDSRGGTVEVLVHGERTGLQLEITQRLADLPRELEARMFDHTFVERPGGFASAVGMAAGRLAFESHGGRVELGRLPERGFSLRAGLPRHD